MNINCNKLYKIDIIRKYNIKYGNYSINEDFIFMIGYLKYAQNIRFIPHALYHWIRVQGVATGVSSIPENLLQIYELSHRMLSDYSLSILRNAYIQIYESIDARLNY